MGSHLDTSLIESAMVSLVYALARTHPPRRLADCGSVLLDTTKMLGTLLPLIAIANSSTPS
jgi:hypothetical protein